MKNLPIKITDNVFYKIKNFFKKIFGFEKVNQKLKAVQENNEMTNEQNSFKENIKVHGIKEGSLEEIRMQENKNRILETFAQNTELLNNLTMDELIKLEAMYDEEIKKY